ncbi:MAG: hypothetical protein Q8P76_01795 [bacterium]|nr:hypothetical protein [bacterium]
MKKLKRFWKKTLSVLAGVPLAFGLSVSVYAWFSAMPASDNTSPNWWLLAACFAGVLAVGAQVLYFLCQEEPQRKRC